MCRRSRRRVSLAALALLCIVAPARAQSRAGDAGGARLAEAVGGDDVASLIHEADALYDAGRPSEAYDLLVASDHLSHEYELLWRAARAGAIVAIDIDGNRAQNVYLDPALDFGSRAVAADPSGVDGRYWRGVVAGRRAMNAAPGYALELSALVSDDAEVILATDSLHAGAHHLLGSLNYEVMRRSRLERAIARRFKNSEVLEDRSWELAETHLRRATVLEPSSILFHLDLAILLRRRGRHDEAVSRLQAAMALPPSLTIDPGLLRQAHDLLIEMYR